MLPLILGLAFAAMAVIALILAFAWRRVVPTNDVHIVQSQKKTKSYGAGLGSNVYYSIPSFIPVFGVTVMSLPVSNFQVNLKDYEAYDSKKVPFRVDVTAFFRIEDTGEAAKRIPNLSVMNEQLHQVVQGAVRSVLAKKTVHEIMSERATFGDMFTQEVSEQLKGWGITTVKNLELMDVRDAPGSRVITDIQAMDTSTIEMESRKKVAENKAAAEMAEVAARQAADLRKQEAEQVVGIRTAEQVKTTGIADEQAKQEIAAQAAITKQREMEVLSVDTQRRAQIQREAALVKAEEDKQTQIIRAEGARQAQVIAAEAEATAATSEAAAVRATAIGDADALRAKGEAEAAIVQLNGAATAEAKKLLEMATVTPQIELNTAIGQNPGFMDLQVRLAQVEAGKEVGIAQANALSEGLNQADIKIIANSSDAQSGIAGLPGVLTSRTGQGLGAMLEGLAQTPVGAAVIAAAGAKVAEDTTTIGRPKANGASRN